MATAESGNKQVVLKYKWGRPVPCLRGCGNSVLTPAMVCEPCKAVKRRALYERQKAHLARLRKRAHKE